MENKTLFTDRLILRTPAFEDAKLIYEGWTSDENTNKYVSWSTHKSIDATKEYIDYCMKEIKNGNFH